MQHYTLKIAVVGDSGVGKSALALRLATKRFRSAHDATIGVEFQVHTLDVSAADGTPRRVKLQIWDTAGQEQFMALTRNYFRNIAGAIIVYAVDNPTSMSNVERWVGEIRHHNPDVEVPILVCGNKADLVERCVDRKLYGNLPRCPECGIGKLKVTYPREFGHGGMGTFTCPGGYDDDAYVRCGFRASQVERPAWVVSEWETAAANAPAKSTGGKSKAAAKSMGGATSAPTSLDATAGDV